MKKSITLVLLFPLIASCVVYESMKTERTMAEIDEKETSLQNDLDKTQKDMDQVEKEIEEQNKDKKNTAN
jgi:septal ring factor EnvC (AmiA/AmiB activator)